MAAPIFPRDEAPSPWDPGRRLAIVGLIFSLSGIFCGILGLAGAVICLVALLRSRRAGSLNKYAVVGIVVGVLFAVVSIYIFAFVPIPVPGN